MAQKFLARVGGETKQVEAAASSTGTASAGKIPAAGSNGRLDMSWMPEGLGTDTQILSATETLSAGSFVNIFLSEGAACVRLADNSNGRPADGYVLDAVTASNLATVYPLDGVNSGLSSLTIAAKYWLGTAGGVISTPLDESAGANVGKISQYLGKAKSTSELITQDDGYVIL